MLNFIDDKTTPRLRIDQDSLYPLLIHVDPGHGGIFNGTYQTLGKQWDFGDFQIYEGQQNRIVAKLLAYKFMANHVSYNFTTISNYDESLSHRMEYVKHVMKSYPKYKHLLLSIHADATNEESNANGVSFYTTPNITDSDFASNYYYPYLQELGLRVRITRATANEYDKESNFYVIRKIEEFGGMGILTELGFMTNREEALKILTPEFQDSAATALLKGTLDVINKLKSNGGKIRS